jgi:hypothetical protein
VYDYYICFMLYFEKKNCDMLTIRVPTVALKSDTTTHKHVINLLQASANCGHIQGGIQQRKIH